MTSQNSANHNISFFRLLRDDLRHKTWMVALSILGSFLAGPVCVLFVASNSGRYYTNKEDALLHKMQTSYQLMGGEGILFLLIVAFLGALIVGWFGFRYLYSKRMSDLYHSAPVTRRNLFLVSWLNGLLIWLVPFLVFQCIDCLACALYIGDPSCLGTLVWLTVRSTLFLILCFLIVYHTCLVAVMLSGNVPNAIVNTLIYGLFFIAAYGLWASFMSCFTDFFYLPDSVVQDNLFFVLSPLSTPVAMMVRLINETPFREWVLLPVLGAVLMLLNWVLAFLFYRKRPSELAERGLDNKVVRVFLRAGTSVLSGMAFSLFFYAVTDWRGRRYWMIFGALFGSALAFCILNIIYHTTFKKLLAHKLQYAVTLAVTCALIFALARDIFGYDRYVPKKENITGISLRSVSFTGEDSSYALGKYGLETRENAWEPSEDLVLTNQEAIYDLLTCAAGNKPNSNYLPVQVKVYTRFGSYYRQYRIAYEDMDCLRPFIESEEYLNEYYGGIQMQFGMPVSAVLQPSETRDPEITDPERLQTLLEALHQDFREHSSMEDLIRTNRMCSIILRYAGRERTVAINYEIPSWYEHTLALLKEWYPMLTWDLGDLEYESIHFSLAHEADSKQTTPLECLYEYFGYSQDGRPLEPPIRKSDFALVPSADSYSSYYTSETDTDYGILPEAVPEGSANDISEMVIYDWELDIDSPEMLQKLKPYLLMRNYNNPLRNDYVELGKAMLPDETGYRCYIPYGKLPLELIQWLADNVTVTPLQVEDSTYKDEDSPYVYPQF